MSHQDDPRRIETLLAIMARLRDPKSGCPWDVEQNFASIAPYTVEEAYEVADAIERNDMDQLKDELGDLLFQVVFHSRMAEEAGTFSFADVVQSISEKMIRRHPHVFADADVKTADAQTAAWEEQPAIGPGRRKLPRGRCAVSRRTCRPKSRVSRSCRVARLPRKRRNISAL